MIAYVNGAEVGRAPASCPGAVGGPYTNSFVPCSGSASFDAQRDTAQWPFQNGANTVAIRVEDFEG